MQDIRLHKCIVTDTRWSLSLVNVFLSTLSAAVLPSEAHAKIVFRLVPGQSPDRVFSMLEEHVAKLAPVLAQGLHVVVQRLNPGARAYKADRKSLGFSLVTSVLTDIFGQAP